MLKLRTATGKEFDCGYLSVLPSPQWAYIRIHNESVSSIAVVFSDPSETRQMRYGDIYLEQYTVLKNIMPESDCVRITLEKE